LQACGLAGLRACRLSSSMTTSQGRLDKSGWWYMYRLCRVPGLCESEDSSILRYVDDLSQICVGGTLHYRRAGYGDSAFPFSPAHMQITTIFAEAEEVLSSGFHQALRLSLTLQPPSLSLFEIPRGPHAHAQSLTSLLRTRSLNLNHLNLDLSSSFYNLVFDRSSTKTRRLRTAVITGLRFG